MSNKADEKQENELFQASQNALFFDKRNKKEETPYEIPEEQQIYCELLESYFESICPKQTLDESMVL